MIERQSITRCWRKRRWVNKIYNFIFTLITRNGMVILLESNVSLALAFYELPFLSHPLGSLLVTLDDFPAHEIFTHRLCLYTEFQYFSRHLAAHSIDTRINFARSNRSVDWHFELHLITAHRTACHGRPHL